MLCHISCMPFILWRSDTYTKTTFPATRRFHIDSDTVRKNVHLVCLFDISLCFSKNYSFRSLTSPSTNHQSPHLDSPPHPLSPSPPHLLSPTLLLTLSLPCSSSPSLSPSPLHPLSPPLFLTLSLPLSSSPSLSPTPPHPLSPSPFRCKIL